MPFLIAGRHRIRSRTGKASQELVAAKQGERDDVGRGHGEREPVGKGSRVCARIAAQRLVEGQRVRVAQSLAQISFDAPSAAGEVRAGRYSVGTVEDADESGDFPSSTPCVRVNVAP